MVETMQNLSISSLKKLPEIHSPCNWEVINTNASVPIEFFMCHIEQAQSPFFTGVIKILQIDCHSQHHTVLLSAGAKLALRLLSALFIPMAHPSPNANTNSRQVTVPIVL